MLNISVTTYFRDSVDMSMVCFHTKFHISNSCGSSVVRFRPTYSLWHILWVQWNLLMQVAHFSEICYHRKFQYLILHTVVKTISDVDVSITDSSKLKYTKVKVVSNGIMFIPGTTKIYQLVQHLLCMVTQLWLYHELI
jgi:hypothetical protein